MGRPTRYDPDKNILVQGWARDGLSQEQIAHNLGICQDTLIEWKKRYPEFAEALKKGKDVADFEVENALHRVALQGNVTAQIFWLCNRKRAEWRSVNRRSEERGQSPGEIADDGFLDALNDEAAKLWEAKGEDTEQADDDD